ncbi:Uncharacterized protein dnm_028860 [Desulfonema magnum]|uniref:Uncharacterized protein n=1 Tax=Desulfonema magnum TaxID=45655 RepID=A0A975GMF9_9BACT|nr:Uncharacterized protein dnm_028860 [Desulfonema magnum]
MIRPGQKPCHFYEGRNPFFAHTANPGTMDSCFRRNDKKSLIIEC